MAIMTDRCECGHTRSQHEIRSGGLLGCIAPACTCIDYKGRPTPDAPLADLYAGDLLLTCRLSSRARERHTQALWYAWGPQDAGDTATSDDGRDWSFACFAALEAERYERQLVCFLRPIRDQYERYTAELLATIRERHENGALCETGDGECCDVCRPVRVTVDDIAPAVELRCASGGSSRDLTFYYAPVDESESETETASESESADGPPA